MVKSCVKLLNCMSLKCGLNKGYVIFSDIFKSVLSEKFVLQISLNCDPDFLTNDKSALVQPSLSLVLGVKPLSKSVTDGFTDGCNTTKLLQVKCCHQLQFHPC